MSTRSMSEWQPIETAPKDGSDVIAWADEVVIVSYRHDDTDPYGNNYGKMWLDNSFDDCWRGLASVPYDPTHWMPLPEPPQGDEND